MLADRTDWIVLFRIMMKYVNFVDQRIEERNKKFKTWFLISLIIFSITSVIIITLQIREFLTWKIVTQKYELITNKLAQYQAISEQKKHLEAQQHDLNNKLKILNNFKQQSNTIIERVMTLQTLNSKNCTLLSCSLLDNKVDMTIECPTLEIVHRSVASLAQNAFFKEITIQSIIKTKNKTLQVVCKIRDA